MSTAKSQRDWSSEICAIRQSSKSGVKRAGAFTLVELLVVIGIIALLIAILLPALNKARAAGQTTQCLANIRQLQIALSGYMQDNFGHTAPYMAASFWSSQLTPYYTGKPYDPNSPANTANSIRLCPTAYAQNPGLSAINANQGACFYCWGPDPTHPTGPCQLQTCSYMYNGWLYFMGTTFGITSGEDGKCEGNINSGDIPNYNSTNPIVYFWQTPNIGQVSSSAIPTIADGMWEDGWPCENDPTPESQGWSLYAGPSNGGNTDNMARICLARHNLGKYINVAFLDGHAQTVPLSGLWQLQWHKNWQTPSLLPKP